jgi:Putative addiction module component
VQSPSNRVVRKYNSAMSIKEIEAAALKPFARDRARLAEKLLESLENLSNAENEILWAEEAERRDATWSSSVGGARTAKRVLRDARAKIR